MKLGEVPVINLILRALEYNVRHLIGPVNQITCVNDRSKKKLVFGKCFTLTTANGETQFAMVMVKMKDIDKDSLLDIVNQKKVNFLLNWIKSYFKKIRIGVSRCSTSSEDFKI